MREIVEALPAEAIRSQWLGYPPASDEQIRQVEVRLAIGLPPSYRAFLQVSNGWRATGLRLGEMWSTEKIEWFRTGHQDVIDAWFAGVRSQAGPLAVPDEKYFVYGDDQMSYNIRDEYLQTALELGDIVDNSVYLLNPQIVTSDGEWEAWFFAQWLPGACRYRSFWDLMQAEYKSFLRLRDRRRP